MIDVVAKRRARRRWRTPCSIVHFLPALRVVAEFTADPDDVRAFATLIEAMGPVAADAYILSQPPSLLWVRRLLERSTVRTSGSGWLTSIGVLDAKFVLVD